MKDTTKLIPIDPTIDMVVAAERWLGNIQHMRAADKRSAITEAIKAAIASSPAAPTADAPKLSVWYGSMPESNGKTNWTAILHRGEVHKGITIDRSEYPDRVRYEADRIRWLIGELAEDPFILDYDADKHSGYDAPPPAKTDERECARCGLMCRPDSGFYAPKKED